MSEKKKITAQRLRFLLENWGCWERSAGRVGPAAATVCGSVERRYADMQERYVWDGPARAVRESPDDPVLAVKTEEVLARLQPKYRRVIIMRYVSEYSLLLIASKSGISLMTAEALYDTALSIVWRELEETAWASGI